MILNLLFFFFLQISCLTKFTTPLTAPSGTVTEVFKIGKTLEGNEEYCIQLKGIRNNVVYAFINFYYYKSDIYGFKYIPPYYPYCIINYISVPYFSRIQTVDDYLNKSLDYAPNFSLNYLANYILNFALNFMQSCLNTVPIYCYSFVSMAEWLMVGVALTSCRPLSVQKAKVMQKTPRGQPNMVGRHVSGVVQGVDMCVGRVYAW